MLNRRTAQLIVARVVASAIVALSIAAAPTAQTRTRRAPARHPAAKASRPAATPKLDCGDWVPFQVLLDRQGFSPGQIDGKPGMNFSHALAALQQARGLPVTGQPDCATWQALGGDSSGPMVATYTITDDDVKGPFAPPIPRELDREARLPSLGYTSLMEKLGERFHASPAVLRQLNANVKFAAGTDIKVPAVLPFEIGIKPEPAQDPTAVTVQVTKDDSAVRAIRGDGTVIMFAPVTTGSLHDPLPQGTWKVVEIDWMPVFHYNPKLFWDAKATDTRATLKPGPNNPVGVVWIGLSLEHYGLHGTPEPGNIGHTESHGCVRMTNWDAARLASLVGKGTTVLFK